MRNEVYAFRNRVVPYQPAVKGHCYFVAYQYISTVIQQQSPRSDWDYVDLNKYSTCFFHIYIHHGSCYSHLHEYG